MLWVKATCLPTKQFNEIYGALKKKKLIIIFTNFIIFPCKFDSVLWYLVRFVHYSGLADNKMEINIHRKLWK